VTRALIVGRDLKTHAGAGADLLKDRRDVFALQRWQFGASIFCHLQVGREFEQEGDFARRKVTQGQKMPVFL